MPDSREANIMGALVAVWILVGVWIVVSILWLVLMLYRSWVTRRETDWIPLSNDAKEEKAVQAQEVSETKVHKLDRPIRALGWLSMIMLLVVVGVWIYHGIMTPPPMPK
jgi:formate-dependent nitrite reductase membrane component NrfD